MAAQSAPRCPVRTWLIQQHRQWPVFRAVQLRHRGIVDIIKAVLTVSANDASKTYNGQTFLVHGFRISGNTVFGEAELIAQLDDAEGKPFGLGDLLRLTYRIIRHYRNAGYPVARAYLPA